MNLIGSDEEAHHTDDISVLYTKHQLEQCIDVEDKTPTINSILPLIGLKTAFCDVLISPRNLTPQITNYYKLQKFYFLSH